MSPAVCKALFFERHVIDITRLSRLLIGIVRAWKQQQPPEES